MFEMRNVAAKLQTVEAGDSPLIRQQNDAMLSCVSDVTVSSERQASIHSCG
jgi:hypothetical protein